MIKSLTLKNFRQYVDRTFEFGPGLVVIRGDSEAGKTTIVEAISYAMFGSKMLRDSVTDAVNWDAKKMSSMKVIVEIMINGVLYNISRGKSGAEINYREESVTGQAECSKFMEELLQIPKGRVTDLLLAGQNDVQGILKQGSAALAVTIEKLAGFEQVDQLIDKVKEKYPSGAAAHLEEQLTELKERLKNLPAPADYTEELEELAADRKTLGDESKTNDKLLETARRREQETTVEISKLETAVTKVETIRESQQKAQELEEKSNGARSELDKTNTALQDKRFLQITEGDGELQLKIDRANAAMSLLDTYVSFKAFPQVDKHWAKGKDNLLAEHAELLNDIEETKEIVRGLETEITIAKSRINSDDTCVTCHQSIKDIPEIIELNAVQERVISGKSKEISAHQELLQEAYPELSDLQKLMAAGEALDKELVLFEDSPYLKIDRSLYPAEVTWVGSIPTGDLDKQYDEYKQALVHLSSLQEQMEELKAEEKKLKNYHATKTSELQSYKTAHSTVLVSLADVADLDLTDVSGDLQEQQELLNTYATRILNLEESNIGIAERIKTVGTREQAIELDVKTSAARKDELEKQLDGLEVQLEEVSFGAALLKTVRDARVKVANKLWGVVLSTVSSYFTTMRGIPTIVTKSDKGFKVNEKALESLSGSTLDICGVALRLAVIQIFLPATNFAIFDEASAGCDEDRTSAVTGFLMGSGFEQTFLITHKEIDEGAANQLIVV